MTVHIDTYFDAWNETDSDARRLLLERCLTVNVELIDPTGRFEGLDDLRDRIGAFHEQLPGARVVKSSGVDEHNGIVRYGWDIVDPQGNTVMEGLDVAEQHDDGRLRRIVMFHGPLPAVE
jgi:hypothetical protein